MVVVVFGLIFIFLVEIIIRLIYPRPMAKRDPQVRVELDSSSGYRNRSNQKAFSLDKVATINSFGFRGPEFQAERQLESLRILGLGNSITFGGGVGDDETYLAYLNNRLDSQFPGQKNEVLNAAIYGFTLRQYVPFLEKVLPQVQPDVVLLGACWRDLHFNPRFGQLQTQVDEETWEMVKKKFRERIIKKDFKTTIKEKRIKIIKDMIRYWRTVYVANYYLQAFREVIKPQNYTQWQKLFLSGSENEEIRQRRVEAKKTLGRMQEICKDRDAKFILFIFPDHKQINKIFAKSIWPTLLTEICDDLEIPYLDLSTSIRKAYKKYGRSTFVPYDVHHYSSAANEMMAEAIFEFLIEKALLLEHKVSQVVVS